MERVSDQSGHRRGTGGGGGLIERKYREVLDVAGLGTCAFVGLDGDGDAEALRRNGADIIVTDLAELLAPR